MCCCCPGVKNSNEIDPEDNPSEEYKTPREKGATSNSIIAENTNKLGSAIGDNSLASPGSANKNNKV